MRLFTIGCILSSLLSAPAYAIRLSIAAEGSSAAELKAAELAALDEMIATRGEAILCKNSYQQVNEFLKELPQVTVASVGSSTSTRFVSFCVVLKKR